MSCQRCWVPNPVLLPGFVQFSRSPQGLRVTTKVNVQRPWLTKLLRSEWSCIQKGFICSFFGIGCQYPMIYYSKYYIVSHLRDTCIVSLIHISISLVLHTYLYATHHVLKMAQLDHFASNFSIVFPVGCRSLRTKKTHLTKMQ